jgi:hypothetical protein
LQGVVSVVARDPRQRALKVDAYNLLLGYLYEQRRDGRVAKLFRQYVDDCCDVRDASFDELYVAALRATETCPAPLRRRDRFLSLVRQLERVLPLNGMLAECGCFRGLSSYVICSRIKRHDPSFDGRGYEIYDSFQGLSAPQGKDSAPDGGADVTVTASMKAGQFAASLEVVRRALMPFPGIDYFPAWIPQGFRDDNEARYRFVHVDVDLYQPTKDSFEYFWPRLVPGGVVVCDDYNWPGARRAVEEFCEAAGIRYDVTPENQAFFSRPA